MQHCKGEIANNISWQELSWINIYYSVKIFFSGGISFVAVPAFFFITGYLFFRNVEEFGGEAYRGKLHKRARSLLVPYIIWILLCIPLTCLVRYFENFSQNPSLAVQDYFHSIRWLHIFWDHYCTVLNPNLLGFHSLYVAPLLGTMWFVRDLLVMSVCSPIVYFFVKKTGKCGIVFLSVFYLLRIWPSITLSSVSVYFFTLGAYFSLIRKSLTIPIFWESIMYVITCISLIYFVASGGNENFIGWQLTPLYTLAGVLSIFSLTTRFIVHKPSFKIPPKLSDSSFFVYALHIEFALPLGFYIGKMLTLHSSNPIVMTMRYFLTPIIIYTICICIYFVLGKLAPQLLKIVTGNR